MKILISNWKQSSVAGLLELGNHEPATIIHDPYLKPESQSTTGYHAESKKGLLIINDIPLFKWDQARGTVVTIVV